MTFRQAWKNFKRIVWEDSFDVVELFGSINSFGWGLWFIFHPGLFSVDNIYAILLSFGNEYIWGTALVTLGLARLTGVILDRYRLRRTVAMIGIVVWAFICVGFFQERSQAIVVFITFENTLLSAWEYMRHAHRARIRKEIREEIHSDNTKI